MTRMIRGALLSVVFALSAGTALAQANDVNCNQCVDTRDIARKAINSSRIRNGAVRTPQLADGAVTAAKLGLARTVFIEDSGNDIRNCTELRNILASVVGPAAVVLGPGTYACRANSVVIPANVSLIGSGRNLTRINGYVDGLGGLVRLDGHFATLQHISVRNGVGSPPLTFSNAVVIGSSNGTVLGVLINDVDARASGATNTAVGVLALGEVDACELTNVIAVAQGANSNRGFTLNHKLGSIIGTNLWGVGTQGGLSKGVPDGAAQVRNSRFAGSTASVRRVGGVLQVITSHLAGPIDGAVICAGDYDANYAALTNGTFGSGGCE